MRSPGKRFLVGIITAAVLFVSLPRGAAALELKKEWRDNPKTLWTELGKAWDSNVKSYTCDIFAWAYRTPHYIKNFTKGVDEKGKKIEEDWCYRVYNTQYKKPTWILFQYKLSMHEDTEKGSIIDKAVANVLKYTGGTTFNYGYKGTDVAYIKFPYISNKKFAEFPISIADKAMMKILMIASRNEIYQRPLEELKDPRGFSINNLIIGQTMKRFDKMFTYTDKNMIIKAEPSPWLGKNDYTINEKTGWLSIKPASLKKTPTVVKLTFEDKDMKRCKGINKYEAFIDPAEMMFAGLHEYENGKLVGVTQFSNMKLNVDMPESIWTEWFKGRKINKDK